MINFKRPHARHAHSFRRHAGGRGDPCAGRTAATWEFPARSAASLPDAAREFELSGTTYRVVSRWSEGW